MGDVGGQCEAQGWGGQTTGAHKLQVAGVAGKAEEGGDGAKDPTVGEARRKEGEGDRTGGRSEGTLGVISFGFSYCCCVRGRGRRRARAGVGGFGVSVIYFLYITYYFLSIFY